MGSDKIKYWVTTDTHFGHSKLEELSGRPEDFKERIIKGLEIINPRDILIHLGDFCIGADSFHHEIFKAKSLLGVSRWLLKGNHDSKSDIWYLNNGWDFVGNTISFKRFGYNLLFSHRPQEDLGYFDINIHGHFHNSDPIRHEEDLRKIKNNKHLLLYLEHHYKPFNLRSVIEEYEKKLGN